MLNELNRFNRHGDVLVHDQSGDFNYSDGSDVEQYLKAVLERADDLSSCSVELEAAIRDWATEYHLSSKRANLLRGFDFPAGGRVLELGCGCGAVTRYLGEQGLAVDAVEGSPVRSELAAMRCRDLKDVSVYCANFNDVVLPEGHYDLVCLVGVAEYAARFMTGYGDAHPVVSLLARLKSTLAPGGVILVAIENRTGMKYVLGAHEDHYARRFVGINNYFGEQDINTYTLPEWERIVDAAGIGNSLVYLPFPDYKLPTAILSRRFAAENPASYCHLEGVQSRDYVDIFRPPVRESLLWQSAAASGSLDLYANSFLFVLSPDDAAIDQAYRFDFAHLPGFSRRREFCLRAVKPEGEPVVRRRKLVDREADGDLVRQRVVDEPYHRGTLLSVLWARALEIEPDSDRFAGLVMQYLAFLEERDELSIDLTPSNIIVDADGGLRAFDEEWLTSIELSKEFLLFRSVLILMLSAGGAARPYARRQGLETVRDLVLHVGSLAGLDLDTGMEDLIRREETYQRAIAVERSGNPTRKLLSRSIGEDPRYVAPVKSRLYWRSGAKPFVEEHSRHVFVDNADEEQLVRIMLPPEAGAADWIRFNPCERVDDGAGFMRIRRMEIALVDPDSGDRSPVWQVEDPDRIARDGRLSGIRYTDAGQERMFMVTADDPAIELRFIPRRRLPPGHYLEFTAVTDPAAVLGLSAGVGAVPGGPGTHGAAAGGARRARGLPRAAAGGARCHQALRNLADTAALSLLPSRSRSHDGEAAAVAGRTPEPRARAHRPPGVAAGVEAGGPDNRSGRRCAGSAHPVRDLAGSAPAPRRPESAGRAAHQRDHAGIQRPRSCPERSGELRQEADLPQLGAVHRGRRFRQ
ncbi:MAG: class I SAM-dependent methyltransferase [Gammaproteobacteria bacterium]|nr:class I SAM-dependent methyltransferase [Gammaproteobacteria bacterium]